MPKSAKRMQTNVVQHTPAKIIRNAMLERYDAMRETVPAAQFRDDNLGFAHNSQAEKDFVLFYRNLRENKIAGKVCKSNQKMLDHARWHLRTILLSRKSRKKTRTQTRTRRTAQLAA